MQDLEDEQVDGRDRIEDAVAPATTEGMTKIPQSERFKPVGQVVTDLPQDGIERREHDEGLPPELARQGHLRRGRHGATTDS